MTADLSALTNAAIAAHTAGDFEKAERLYGEVIAADPRHWLALANRATLWMQTGRLEEGVQAARASLAIMPSQPATLVNLAAALRALGRPGEALQALEQAAALGSDSPELLNDLGLMRHDNGRAEAAVPAFEQALALRPGWAPALANLGRALHHLDRMDEALARLDEAVAADPAHATAWLHRGDALSALGRFDEALACYQRILALDPANADAWVRQADALGALRRIEEAMVSYNQALVLEPADGKAPFNLALALLREGAYEDGWRLYEYRWRGEQAPALPGRLWLGAEPVEGRTILLHSEQGHGDTLMMLRYAPLLARRGARVILSVQPPLERLAAAVEGVAAVIPQGQALPPFDLHIPMMSLPLAFGTLWDTVPGQPYLAAPPQDVARWAERLGARQDSGKRPRIGLCWSGAAAQSADRWRSIPLEALQPLASLGADLYAVQIDIRERDRAAVSAMGLIPLGPELTDYASTAGLLDNLDLVVTVDTSLAHLAGGMGGKGFVLLGAVPAERWGWEGETNPWYPSLNLFRQERIGDWSGVARAAAAAAGEALARR